MKIENKQDLILDFIKQFRDLGAENCFNNGMCYWFSYILKNRFNIEYPTLRKTDDKILTVATCTRFFGGNENYDFIK